MNSFKWENAKLHCKQIQLGTSIVPMFLIYSTCTFLTCLLVFYLSFQFGINFHMAIITQLEFNTKYFTQ